MVQCRKTGGNYGNTKKKTPDNRKAKEPVGKPSKARGEAQRKP